MIFIRSQHIVILNVFSSLRASVCSEHRYGHLHRSQLFHSDFLRASILIVCMLFFRCNGEVRSWQNRLLSFRNYRDGIDWAQLE